MLIVTSVLPDSEHLVISLTVAGIVVGLFAGGSLYRIVKHGHLVDEDEAA
jgi:hypothetical protein